MMKKTFISPKTEVVSVATEALIAGSGGVQNVSTPSSVNIRYGGGNNGDARVKDATEVYDVWDDDWSN